jgi:hypothetical protein
MVERSDQPVNSPYSQNTVDVLAKWALGLRLDQHTAVGAIAFPSLVAGILWTRVSPPARASHAIAEEA